MSNSRIHSKTENIFKEISLILRLLFFAYSKKINLSPSRLFSITSYGVHVIKEAQMIANRDPRIKSICKAEV